jgi:hypothetical protein
MLIPRRRRTTGRAHDEARVRRCCCCAGVAQRPSRACAGHTNRTARGRAGDTRPATRGTGLVAPGGPTALLRASRARCDGRAQEEAGAAGPRCGLPWPEITQGGRASSLARRAGRDAVPGTRPEKGPGTRGA